MQNKIAGIFSSPGFLFFLIVILSMAFGIGSALGNAIGWEMASFFGLAVG